MWFKSYANSYIDTLIDVLKKIDIDDLKKIEEVFVDAYKNDRIVYVMGNWWSASTSSHWACDFNKWTAHPDKKRFRFISLNDNIAHFTAIANDISYDDIFSEQLKNVLTKNDVVVIISASWNSKNVVKALEYGNQVWAKTVAIVWFTWWKSKEIADYSVHVKSMDYGPVEDIHMIFDHLLSTYFKKAISEWIE